MRSLLDATTLPFAATQSQDEAQRKIAEQVRYRWALADEKDRDVWANKAELLLRGQPLEDDEKTKQMVKSAIDLLSGGKSGTKKVPAEVSEVASEILAEFAPFSAEKCKLMQGDTYATLANPTFDDYIEPEITKDLSGFPLPKRKVKLWNLDPMYWLKDQPTHYQFENLRRTFDKMSMVGSVIIVWGKIDILIEKWKPIFAPGFAASKATYYYIDPSLLIMHRDKVNDRHSHNESTFHSMSEHALVVSVVSLGTDEEKLEKKKTKAKKGESPFPLPAVKKFSKEFLAKFGYENGSPTNIVKMKPPHSRERLRDRKGKIMRKNAEKSIEICEWCIELFTQPGDWVMDLYAGTAIMGVACIKLDRLYQGVEINGEVWLRALERLALFYHSKIRGDLRQFLKKNKPGLLRSVASQVNHRFVFSRISFCRFMFSCVYLLIDNELLCLHIFDNQCA